ncbi:MAG: uroporphyrinogen-III C-methyltransferase [Nitrincola sp.]|nr:uroporphyrinogen-III C-methyltransferase [Nitrincola sp.]
MKNKSDNNDQKHNTDSAETKADNQVDSSVKTEESEPSSVTPKAEAPKQDAPKSSSPDQQPSNSHNLSKEDIPSGWPGKTALVLALAALGLSGYLFLQQQTLHNQTVTLSADIETRLANNASEVARTVATVSEQAASVNQQLGQLQEQTAAGQRNIDRLQERLTQSIQQVQAQQTITETDWLLAEAEYLLRLANQRILMEQNASGALALLRSADEILQRANDVALYPVREALAKDISTLEALPRIDTEGLFLRLSALNAQVPNLRMTPITDRHQLPSLLEEMTPDAVKETWGSGAREAFANAMAKFEQLVVIQHRDEPIQPLLSPEQTYYLQQNLHLMLEQAQHALLQGRQAAYDESLNKASRWITEYFQANDATTIALLEGIEALKSVTVSVEIPAINGSLNALQQHINEIRRLKREGGQG